LEFGDLNILLAEDDAISALVLRKALESMGCPVRVASDGAEALRIVDELGTRLLISDWMMPEMDGLQLCRRLRTQTDAAYIYIIMLTARGRREDRLEALDAGVDDFLVKPLDRSELFARLNVARRILSMQEELRDRQAQLELLRAELEQRNQKLALLAVTDGLTGLYNRRHLFEVLASSYSFAARERLPISLAVLDIDHFKQYNDRFGHPAGDDVLRVVSETIRSQCRSHDSIARYGGEEFVVLMPATDAQASRALAERLRCAIEATEWPLHPVTASCGVATHLPPFREASQLFSEADLALYQSKEQGRNRVTHHDNLVLSDCQLR